MSSAPTPMAAPRPPDGFWIQHPRYRNYVLFAATGIPLSGVGVVLLFGARALGNGSQAWESYLSALQSIPGIVLSLFLLIGTVFFSLRWLRVGAKIPTVQLGPIPAPPMPAILVAHFSGLIVLSALVLLLLSGIVV